MVFCLISCFFKRIRLQSLIGEPYVFSGSSDSCQPKDLNCVVGKYTFFWTSEAIVTCPYYVIKTDFFNKIGNFYSNKLLLFQTTDLLVVCKNLSLYSTSEGLFLANPNQHGFTNLKPSEKNINTEISLVASD